MAHIWSGDVISGTTYDGIWQLSHTISGRYSLQWHLIRDTDDIPWVYAGVDELHIEDALANVVLVTFGTIATDKTDPLTVAAMFTLIDDAITAAVVPYALVSVAFVGATNTFDLTFDDATVFLDFDQSTSGGLFATTGQTTPGLVQLLPANNAKSRPDVMDVFIPTITTPHIATRTPEVSFAVNLQDGYTKSSVLFLASRLLEIRWSQLYAPGIACPMVNEWHLILDQKAI